MDSSNFYKVKSLLHLSLYRVINNANKYLDWEAVSLLPCVLKSKLLDCFCTRGLVNDDTVSYLVDESTTHFVLGGNVLSALGLRKLQVCHKLTHLDLSETCRYHKPISKSVAQLFPSLPYLSYVNLRNCCSLQDNAIVNLAMNCAQLTFLNLSGCINIGDDAIKALGDYCSCLEGLDLAHTKVSDSGVLHFAQGSCSKTLKEFGVGFCQNVTSVSLSVLLCSCSNVRILTWHRISDFDDSDFEEKWLNNGKLLKYTLDV